MQNEIFENLTKMTQQTLENWKKIGETNLKIGEKLLQEQVELTTALVEAATQNAQEIAQTKDAKDIAAIQTELVQEYSKKIVDSCRSCADILAEAGKTYNGLFESALKTAGNDLGKTAKGKKAA